MGKRVVPEIRVRMTRPRNAAKKWRIEVVDTGKAVEFGQAGASDFTKHEDPARMVRYLVRHAGDVPDALKRPGLEGKDIVRRALLVDRSRRERWGADDLARAVHSAGFWSRWLLWSHPSMPSAKRHLRDRFGIVFVEKGRGNSFLASMADRVPDRKNDRVRGRRL